MPPAIIDAANAHRAALLAREQATMQAMAQRWLGVERSLAAATEALALQMANGEEPVTAEQLMRSRRYQELRRQLNAELRRYRAYAETTITDGQRNMITDALSHSQAAIAAVATEAQIVVPFNRLPVATVERMAGLAGDGSPLADVLSDATAGAGDALGQRLVSGIALGQNPVEVARQAIRAGVGQSFTRIATIARSEMLRAYRVTTLESYQASRVVRAYRRLSARDDRVCPGCLFADGREYPIDYGFDSHANCRCTAIPVLANVPPVAYQTGQEWFVTRPESEQLSILGRGRFDAWQAGRATLDDMVTRDWSDTWGGSVRPTLVRDLG
ncbi:minor capsid protein [Caldilinea sp.]|uniref:minor capsid protein n=1 Tax=Caldilinea sp. TaxID=2293560 RepID=UPI002C3F1DBC|nr:minor capsid protein [Caldilinea sp.]